MECEFCEQYNFVKKINQESELENPKIRHERRCKMVVKAYAGTSFRGEIAYEDHPLNFCPECGKKLEQTP